MGEIIRSAARAASGGDEGALPASAELTLLGLIVSVVIAIPLGVLTTVTGVRRPTRVPSPI